MLAQVSALVCLSFVFPAIADFAGIACVGASTVSKSVAAASIVACALDGRRIVRTWKS